MIPCSIFYMGYYENVNDNIYYIFLFGLNFFNLTSFILSSRRKFARSKTIIINGKLIRILEIIVIITIIPMAFVNYKLIASGVPLWKINNDYWSEERGSGTYIYAQYLQMVVSPILVLLVGMTFYKYYSFIKKKSFYVTLIFSISMVLLYSLYTGGGRTEMMILAYTIFLVWIAGKNVKFKSSLISIHSKYFIIAFFILTLCVQLMNIGRNHTESIIENVIQGQTYFVPLFDMYLNHSDIIDNNTFGTSFFEGILQLVSYPFKLLGLSLLNSNTNEIVQDMVYCPAAGRDLNALVTSYYYYLRDFGYFGVFLGPIILAGLFDLLYRFLSINTWYKTYYFCIVLSWCFNSSFFISKSIVMSLVYLIIIRHIGRVMPKQYALKINKS